MTAGFPNAENCESHHGLAIFSSKGIYSFFLSGCESFDGENFGIIHALSKIDKSSLIQVTFFESGSS